MARRLVGVVALLLSSTAMAGPAMRGVTTVRADPGQTTASTKIFKVQNAAGTDKITMDIEGDLVCNDLTVGGTFTLPSTDFASGLTVATNKLTVAASGNTVIAGTLDVTGASTLAGALAANAGLSVDSPAFVVANTTGALTTTGLASLNGGIAVDTDHFTVDGTTGACVMASTLDVTGAVTITGALAANSGISVDSPAFVVSNTSGNVSTTGTVTATGAITANGGVAATTLTTSSTIVSAGTIAGPRVVVIATSGNTGLTTAQSGGLAANQGTSSTTTFTLPGAAAGLSYCFVEAGNAAGELLINPAAGDAIIVQATANGAAVAPAAGTGVKNTAATNVVADHVCLTALDGTTWIQTSVSGTWASQ